MEIALIIGTGILSGFLGYRIGYGKGKKDGHTVGFTYGMFKANELANEDIKRPTVPSKPKAFNGVKHRLPLPEQEPAWIH